jgi:3-oxoacyl-[acyl-carrier-protein] synthase II
MVAGGTEAAIIPVGLGGFVACRALSQRNDNPQTASRPWDKDCEGFIMGEGIVKCDVEIIVVIMFISREGCI